MFKKDYRILVVIVCSILVLLFVLFVNYENYLKNYDYTESVGATVNVIVDSYSPAISQVAMDTISSRTWLGIEGINVNDAIAASADLKRVAGVLISKVVPDSPADKASDGGLKRGDILVKFDRKLVKDVVALQDLIASTEEGDNIRIEVVRNQDKQFFYTQMELRPAQAKITQVAGTAVAQTDTTNAFDTIYNLFVSWRINIFILLLVFLILHYVIFGPKVVLIKSEKYIERFTTAEMINHFILMTTFILLSIIGITLANIDPRVQLKFQTDNAYIIAHVIIGAFFAASLILMFVRWFKHTYYFDDYDTTWIRNFGGYFKTRGNKESFPVNKFNAGQKMFFWFASIIGTITALTGFLLLKDNSYLTAAEYINLTHRIHIFCAYLLLIGVIVHLYLVLLANKGIFRSMFKGNLAEDVAMAHYLHWYKGKKHEFEI